MTFNVFQLARKTGLSIIFWFWHLFWHLGILTILAFLTSLSFWHYEIQKKTALKSKEAKIKAALVFNGVFFSSQDPKMPKMPKMPKWSKCQDAKKDAKMPKGPKMPVPLKKNDNNTKMPKPEKPR